MEIAIKVLEERQNLQDSRLNDVDECCGKLKGTVITESRDFNKRLAKVENGMDIACNDVQIQIKSLEEQNKTQFNDIEDLNNDSDKITNAIEKLDEKLDKKMSKITSYYVSFTLGILGSLVISLIALIK